MQPKIHFQIAAKASHFYVLICIVQFRYSVCIGFDLI